MPYHIVKLSSGIQSVVHVRFCKYIFDENWWVSTHLLICNRSDAVKDYLQKEIEILRTKNHWKKAYFYLWDEVWPPLQNDSKRVRLVVMIMSAHALVKQWCRDYFHTFVALWQNAQWNTIIFFFLYCFDLCYCLISIIMMVPEAMPFSMICLMSWCACINFWQPLNLEQYDSIRKMASEIHAYAPDARVLTTYYCGMNSLPSVLITHSFCYDVICWFLSSVLSSQLFLLCSGDFHDLVAFCFQLEDLPAECHSPYFILFSFLLFPPLLFSCVCAHSWCYDIIS